MRFVIAMMKHETNTFSPVPTSLKSFDIRLDAKKTFPWPPAYDCAAAQRKLGYTPAFTIEEGVEDFIRETKKKYGRR
jgi:nucleoside-diphosphate-sugar epimerase